MLQGFFVLGVVSRPLVFAQHFYKLQLNYFNAVLAVNTGSLTNLFGITSLVHGTSTPKK
jgi:uncharacterized membrane protein